MKYVGGFFNTFENAICWKYLIINCRQNIQSIRNFNNLILFFGSAPQSPFLLVWQKLSKHKFASFHHQRLLSNPPLFGMEIDTENHRRKMGERELKFINWMCGVVVSSSSQKEKKTTLARVVLSWSHNLFRCLLLKICQKNAGKKWRWETINRKSNSIDMREARRENWLCLRDSFFFAGTVRQLKLMIVDWLSASSKMCVPLAVV